MRKAFKGCISRLDKPEERIPELEGTSMEPFKTEKYREDWKKKPEYPRTLDNYKKV